MRVRINRLNHVQVCIPRGAEAEAREFYGKILGLREIEKPEVLRADGGMWFEVADIQLHIGVEEVAAAAAAAPSKRHPAFEIEDVEGVRRYLDENGVRTKNEPPVADVMRFSLFDPFGNRIEFMGRASGAGDARKHS